MLHEANLLKAEFSRFAQNHDRCGRGVAALLGGGASRQGAIGGTGGGAIGGGPGGAVAVAGGSSRGAGHGGGGGARRVDASGHFAFGAASASAALREIAGKEHARAASLGAPRRASRLWCVWTLFQTRFKRLESAGRGSTISRRRAPREARVAVSRAENARVARIFNFQWRVDDSRHHR